MPAKPGPLRPHEERRNYARPQPKAPPPGEPSPGDSFLIVTEGEVTERLYFESIRAALQLSPMTVRVVHPARTDAVGLVRAAIDERNRTGEIGFDHVWVLFDTDVCARQGQLGPALELSGNEHIHVGFSTPSVEVWLYLHFRERPGPLLDGTAAERAVAEAWGESCDKTRKTFVKLWPALQPNVSVAVSRAVQMREYHERGCSPFPPNPSTQLDKLVRALDAAVQPLLRILPQVPLRLS
jgi:hypothetical protein